MKAPDCSCEGTNFTILPGKSVILININGKNNSLFRLLCCGIVLTIVGPYDFRDAESADGIAESSHKNVIYSLMRNVTEFVKVWMN